MGVFRSWCCFLGLVGLGCVFRAHPPLGIVGEKVLTLDYVVRVVEPRGYVSVVGDVFDLVGPFCKPAAYVDVVSNFSAAPSD